MSASRQSIRTVQVRLPRCSSLLPITIDVEQNGNALQQAVLGNENADASKTAFDPSRYRFVVSPTETTPGMIISSNAPLESMGVGSEISDVLEMWLEPDVLQCRLQAWSAGAEDKPTVIDYGVPLYHMLPVLRRRFAKQLAPNGAVVDIMRADDDSDLLVDDLASGRTSFVQVSPASQPAATMPTRSPSSSRSGSFFQALRTSSRRKGPDLLPEVTLRLIENHGQGRAYWLSTARSLKDQGCTPSNSAKSVLEIHRVRSELLRMPKRVDAHCILLRGPLKVTSTSRTGAVKQRSYWCVLIEHFLFLHKKADKTADHVVLLEYHTIHLRPSNVANNNNKHSNDNDDDDDENVPVIQLRRRNVEYSPHDKLVFQLECPNAIELRRWYEQLSKKCMTGLTRVFGVPLEDVMSREPQEHTVPYVLRACAEYLRRDDRLNTVGLFRRAGMRALLEYARDMFDAASEPASLDNVPRVDEIVVASLFKMFFSELPEPLIPFRLYDSFIRTEGERAAVLSLAKAELPTANLEVLFFTATLLKDVCLRANANKMSAKALGIVFGPTLLRQRHGELTAKRLVSDTTVCSKVCLAFIEAADALEPSLERRTVNAASVVGVRVDWGESTTTDRSDSNSARALDLATAKDSDMFTQGMRVPRANTSAQPFTQQAPLSATSAPRLVNARTHAVTMLPAINSNEKSNPYSVIPNVSQFNSNYQLIPNIEKFDPVVEEKKNNDNDNDDEIDFADLDEMANEFEKMLF